MKKTKTAAKAARLGIYKNTPIGKIRDICAALIEQQTGHFGPLDDHLIWEAQIAMYLAGLKVLQRRDGEMFHGAAAAALVALYFAETLYDLEEEPPQPGRKTKRKVDLLHNLPLCTAIVQ